MGARQDSLNTQQNDLDVQQQALVVKWKEKGDGSPDE